MYSCRRSRRRAKDEGDRACAAIMLRTEATLLELMARREDQRDLFQGAEHESAPDHDDQRKSDVT